MNPLVSVIVPVYNVEKYLSKCLDSLMCQTYSNIEVLMIDNCSTDSSYDICKSYHEKDERFIPVSINQKGLSLARNKGIEISRGEYISFVDSDDVVAKDYYELLVLIATKYKVDLVIGESKKIPDDFELLSENEQVNSTDINNVESYSGRELQKAFLAFKVPMYAHSRLFKKDLWADLRFPVDTIYEDVPTTWEISKHVNCAVKSNEPIYYYRQRYDSIVNSTFNPKRLDQVKVSEDIYDEVKSDDELRYMAATRCFFSIADSLAMITKDFINEKKELKVKLCRYRKETIKDKSARKSIKAMAILSYISIGLVSVSGKSYKIIKNMKYKINK